MSGISLLPIVQIKIMLNHDGKRRRQTPLALSVHSRGSFTSLTRYLFYFLLFNSLRSGTAVSLHGLAFLFFFCTAIMGQALCHVTIERAAACPSSDSAPLTEWRVGMQKKEENAESPGMLREFSMPISYSCRNIYCWHGRRIHPAHSLTLRSRSYLFVHFVHSINVLSLL